MALKKLLVADDSLTIQKVIRLALSGVATGSSEGYNIQAVSDGNDAIQQISLFRPQIVLIDVSLPGKTAFEVKRAVNQHRDLDSVRFVLMSSAFEKVDEQQVQEVGFNGRLTKPFDPAHLREILSQVLAQIPDLPPLPENPLRDDEPTLHLQKPEYSSLTPPPFAPPELPVEPENDIRNLTESTIRMSGLADLGAPPEPPSDLPDGDFGWSVQEHSLKPPSAMMDLGDSTFPGSPPRTAPRMPPVSDELELTPAPPADAPFDLELTPPPIAPTAVDSSQIEKKVEEVIQQELEKALRKIAQEMLPDVAERLIKQEIHKLLSETP